MDELTVTVGPVKSYSTVLSLEVEATFPLPAVSLATSAGISAMTVPSDVIPETETV